MKNRILFAFLSLGWVFLALFLLSGYFFNQFSAGVDASNFRPVAWENHLQVFKGAILCNLTDEKILERKKELKEKLFSKVSKKEEVLNGYVYYFENEKLLLEDALDFIQKEKDCCPFFKFDISILPFDYGFAIQISGSEEAFEMLKDFDEQYVWD